MNRSTDNNPGPSGAQLWLMLSLVLGLPAAIMGWVPLDQSVDSWPSWAQSLPLHPDQGWHQNIWALWSAAWLHGSAQHLLRNLIALALLAALASSSNISRQAVFTWLLAWPLTQLGLLGQAMHTYIGLSGVLHAGACVMALHQVTQSDEGRQKLIGYLLIFGLILKILMENPWQHTLIKPPGSDINVAPWAHLTGTLAAAVIYLFTSVTNRLPSVKRLTRGRRTLI